jgi:3-oxoadipate enol-lactonase
MSPLERRYTAAGRPHRYLESGSGQPLVLLHAFPLNADLWEPQLAEPPAGWRIIAPNLRGFRGARALEAPPVGTVTMDDYARDVLALLDHLGLERAVVGGASMGGYVTFALYRLAPERVGGLVLANTRPQADTPEGRARRSEMLALVEREGAAGVANDMLPKLLGETTHRERPAVVTRVRQMIEVNTAEGIAAAIGAMRDRPDSSPLLSRIDVPTLLVAGGEDTLIPPATAEEMAAAIAGAQLSIIADAGHLSNLENPRSFQMALRFFLGAGF